MARYLWFFFLAFAVSGCLARDKGHNLRIIFSEVPVTAPYTIDFTQAEAIGWNDSFQSGFVVFDGFEDIEQLVAKSVRVGTNEYIPIKRSSLEAILRDNPSRLWVYKSEGKRDRRLYYIVQEKQIVFDLLVL